MGKGKTAGKLPNRPVKQYKYTPEAFIPVLKELVEASKQSYRQISLGAGLDHGAVQRYLKRGAKPSRDACIALAEYFDLHPNILLEKAGYSPRAYFDPGLLDPEDFPLEVKKVAQELMKIEDPATRHRICSAVMRLLQEMFTQTD